MGATRRENDVLKLVHPGRFMEFHREPITAAEVMRRNPRHSVTRPDVFEYPWIVVRPEAVLVPGKVFFIVPNSKIYQLLKAKRQCREPSSPQQMQSPEDHVHRRHRVQTSGTAYARRTPMHQSHNQQHHMLTSAPYAGSTPMPHRHNQTPRHHSKNMYFDDLNSREKDRDERHKKYSRLQSCSQERNRQEIRQKSQEASAFKIKCSCAYQKSCRTSTRTPKREHALEVGCSSSRQVPTLKSCLRKPNSYRKSLNLRVTFELPIHDEKPERRVSESPTEFAEFYDW